MKIALWMLISGSVKDRLGCCRKRATSRRQDNVIRRQHFTSYQGSSSNFRNYTEGTRTTNLPTRQRTSSYCSNYQRISTDAQRKHIKLAGSVPIEHIWDELGRHVRQHPVQAQTLQELKDALQEEWRAFPIITVRTAINSMRRRCHTVIANRGGHTYYWPKDFKITPLCPLTFVTRTMWLSNAKDFYSKML